VGGGIKTSTFAVYIAMVIAYLRGKENVEMFGRTIPTRITSKAMAMIATSFAVVLLSTVLLQISEGGRSDYAMRRYFLDFLFETVSAYGTVGLSTGVTSGLRDTSKVIIICTMFAGRVGPLGIALSLFGREDVRRFKYPEENVMIG
jgi:trk system potassium uptake protein TrkH